ncbi:MAG: glycosyltransferase family 4 protein [Lachnospiraceae bacterium]
MAGGSSHSSEYEEQIKKQAAQINSQGKGSVIMTGFVQGQELQELFSNAMLYILPSEIEGMPLSLLEAMSYGNLCLTSDIPENMDVTNEHGLTFPQGNEEELCRILQETVLNIAEIRKNPAYTKETVSRCVLERYDWDDIVKRTLAVYESINRQ